MTQQMLARLDADAADIELIGESVAMILASVRRSTTAMRRLALDDRADLVRIEQARARLVQSLGSLGGQLDVVLGG